MPGTHKRFSASSLHRIRDCPASLSFCESLPPSKLDTSDNIWSRRGTSAHAVGEMVLSSYLPSAKKVKWHPTPEDYLGQTVESVLVDKEIIDGVDVYVDYVKKCLPGYQFFDVEKQLDLSHFDIPNGHETGGTMDFIGIRKYGTLHVTDYKNGRVIVEVIDNMQLLCYALCAFLAYNSTYFFKDIIVTVVQPNAYHEDGPIRSMRITPKQLMAWARGELTNTITNALAVNPRFNPGESQCQYCPGRAHCKALTTLAHSTALTEFADAGVDMEPSLPDPRTLTKQQRLNVLRYASLLTNFIDSVREHEHKSAQRGDIPGGFKLIKVQTHRRYMDIKHDPNFKEERLHKTLRQLGMSPADYTVPMSLVTPSQLESAMKRRGVNPDRIKLFMEKFVFQPDGGTKLVLESARGKAIHPAMADFEDEGLFDD